MTNDFNTWADQVMEELELAFDMSGCSEEVASWLGFAWEKEMTVEEAVLALGGIVEDRFN